MFFTVAIVWMQVYQCLSTWTHTSPKVCHPLFTWCLVESAFLGLFCWVRSFFDLDCEERTVTGTQESQALMPFCFCYHGKNNFPKHLLGTTLSKSSLIAPRHVQNSSHYWPRRSRVKSWNITGQRGTGVHLIPVCWNVARWTDTMWFR